MRVAQRPAAPRCAVKRNDEYLCTGGRPGLPYANTRLSKQAGAFRVHSTFRTCFALRRQRNLQSVDCLRRRQLREALAIAAESYEEDRVLASATGY